MIISVFKKITLAEVWLMEMSKGSLEPAGATTEVQARQSSVWTSMVTKIEEGGEVLETTGDRIKMDTGEREEKRMPLLKGPLEPFAPRRWYSMSWGQGHDNLNFFF